MGRYLSSFGCEIRLKAEDQFRFKAQSPDRACNLGDLESTSVLGLYWSALHDRLDLRFWRGAIMTGADRKNSIGKGVFVISKLFPGLLIADTE